jgi:protein-disulfide isomerase
MTTQAPRDVPDGATVPGDGIALGHGPVTVDAYIDFLCPYCREFELAAATTLNAMVAQGGVTLVYHPMSFLDGASTTRYSTRAAAAAGCAADAGQFADYLAALFTHQPQEGGPGLPDEELIRLGLSIGLTDEAFGACVRAGRYLDWPSHVTDLATERGVSATPTVLVDGAPVEPEARAIADAAGVPEAGRG